jgi:DNA-binding NarL/FixJ family response regulator
VTDKHPTRVLIADDHALVRAGIRALLEKVATVEVVAEAADGREALDLTGKHQPDVVLMDIAMPGLSGLEATRRFGKISPATHIIILSMHDSEEYVWQALRAGARGYLLKGASLAELELAIKVVAEDHIYLSPAISKSLIADYLRPASEHRAIGNLTPRQREILQMIAEGKSTKQIALDLNISVKTVDTHRPLRMKRLNVHDLASLVRYAVKIGLVTVLAILG